jgi:outer membrane protein TolC
MKRPRLTPLILAASLAWLAGCRVGPDYVRPQASAPAAFEEAPPADAGNWKAAAPADSALGGAWWKVFSDTDLDALEVQVEQANQSLKSTEAHFREARGQVKVRKSYEAPTIGASPAVESVRQSYNQPYFNSSEANGGEGSFNMPLDLNYEIDLWGRIRRHVRNSKQRR